MSRIYPQIYIDPFNGRDGADGTTRASAVRTKAGLLALPLMGPKGTSTQPAILRNLTIGIVGHPTAKIREQFDFFNPNEANGFRIMQACSWVRVGSERVLGDCTDPVPAASIAPRSNGTFAVQWQHDLHEVGVCRFRVFSNARPLRRVAREAEVTPGHYWYEGSPVAGVPKLIVFAPFDGRDPRTSGDLIEITARDVFISVRGGLVEGIFAERNGHNSGSIINGRDVTQVSDPSSLRAVLVYEGTKHNAVFGHGEHIDLIAVNCRDNDFDPDGEIGTLLTLAQRDLEGETAVMTRCAAFADPTMFGNDVAVGQNTSHAFLTHDTNAGGGLSTLELRDCWSAGLAGGWDFASARSVGVRGHYSPLLTGTSATASHLASAGSFPIVIERSLLGGGNTTFRWVDARNVSIRSSALLTFKSFSGGGITTLGRPGSISVTDSFLIADQGVAPPFIDLAGGSLDLRRTMMAGAFTAFSIGSGVTATSDGNLHKPLDGGRFYMALGGDGLTLEEWRAKSGKDGSTQAIASATDAGFVSGRFPSPFEPDLTLAAGSKASATLQNPLTPQEVATMRARPTTLSAAISYLLTAPSRRPVFE